MSNIPRVVHDELGPAEIGAEWLDYDGDRWRFGPEGFWQYLEIGRWKNAVPMAAYAPFTEVS